MAKLTKKEFRKCSLTKRYNLLKKEGEHVAARQSGVHRIHLFTIYGFFVEIWIVISLDQIQWIEIQENESIIKSYSDQVDVRGLFDDP
jgi:hypothetical protein